MTVKGFVWIDGESTAEAITPETITERYFRLRDDERAHMPEESRAHLSWLAEAGESEGDVIAEYLYKHVHPAAIPEIFINRIFTADYSTTELDAMAQELAEELLRK